MSQLPKWANPPHKDAVATAKGWETAKGEVLVAHKGLDEKIKMVGGKGGLPPVEATVDVAVEAAEEVGEAVKKANPFKKKKKK